jgi:dihydroorotase
MEKTLQQIEDLWKKKEQPILTNYIQNHELAKQFADGKIILEHSTKEEDIWMIRNLQRKFNLTDMYMVGLYCKPLPYKERYFYVIGDAFIKGRNNVIWDVPEGLMKIKPIIHIYELYTKYPNDNEQ